MRGNRGLWFYVVIFHLELAFSRGRKRFRNAGFGLLDTAISLAIAGVLVVAVLKGYNLVEQARLMGVATQADQLLIALHMSDEPLSRSGQWNVPELWGRLVEKGFISVSLENGYPVSKAGGVFDILSAIDGHPGTWLVLTAEGGKVEGVLTPAQAEVIDRKRDTGDPTTGAIQVLDRSGKCFSGKKYNLKEIGPTCVLLFRIF
jgi:hypothetical protein